MRESFSQDVLAIGQLQKDINQFLRRRVEGNYTFFASFYRENLLTTVALVDAVNTTPTDLPAQSIEGPPPADVVQEESGRQSYREKWKRGSDEGRVSIDGTVPLETASNVDVRPTIATPVPLWDVSEGSRTPTSRTTRTSFAFSPVTWGDRYRSMTPVDSPVFRPMMIPEGIPQECTQYQDPNATASMMDIDKPNDTQRADHISDEVSAAQTTEIVKEKRLSGGVLDVTGANGLESKKSEKECHEEAPAEESLPEVADTRSANPTEKEAPVLPSDADMDGIEASQKEQEKEETVLRRRKESMIPKPPGTALVSTVQKMKNLVTLVDHAPAHLIDLKTAHPATEKEVPPPAAATKKDKTEETHCAKQVNAEHPVRSFIDAVKRMEEVKIASGAHKAEVSHSCRTVFGIEERVLQIPALKKAALAREQEEKREAARKTRKDKRDQWKKLQKQQTQPAKIASKPEPPPGGKRTSAIEPSPNKKQRTEQIRPNKKVRRHSALPHTLSAPLP